MPRRQWNCWVSVTAAILVYGCGDGTAPTITSQVKSDTVVALPDTASQGSDASQPAPDVDGPPEDAGDSVVGLNDSADEADGEQSADGDEGDAASVGADVAGPPSGIVVRGTWNRWPGGTKGQRTCSGKVCVIGGLQ
jgi:hypothetical protein